MQGRSKALPAVFYLSAEHEGREPCFTRFLLISHDYTRVVNVERQPELEQPTVGLRLWHPSVPVPVLKFVLCLGFRTETAMGGGVWCGRCGLQVAAVKRATARCGVFFFHGVVGIIVLPEDTVAEEIRLLLKCLLLFSRSVSVHYWLLDSVRLIRRIEENSPRLLQLLLAVVARCPLPSLSREQLTTSVHVKNLE